MKKILKLICFIVMIFLFIILGTKDYKKSNNDNIRFSNEYKDINKNKNNIYKYVNDNFMVEFLNKGNGVVLACFASNIWCHYYADYLNEVAINNSLTEIYYYDFKRDRSIRNSNYNKIVDKLSDYLFYNDNEKHDLYAPSIIIVKNGKITYFLDDVRNIKGKILPENYFTDNKKNTLKNNINNAIKDYLQKKSDNL